MRVLLFMLSCLCGLAQDPATLACSFNILYPTNVPNLIFWVTADFGTYKDLGSTLCVNGDSVQQWNDRSGNNYHLRQDGSANRPKWYTGILNGYPAVGFSAQNMSNYLGVMYADPNSVFIVVKSTNSTTGYFCQFGESPTTVMGLYQNVVGPVFNAIEYNANMSFVFRAETPAWYVFTCVFEGALKVNPNFTSCAYYNGRNGLTGQLGTYTTNGVRRVFIGSTYDQTSQLRGYVVECAVYNRRLSSAEMRGLELGAKLKYAINYPF